MTKILSFVLSGLVCSIAMLLPRWKKSTFIARLYERLQPFEKVTVNGRDLDIFVPDRTSIYWAKYAPESEPITNRWIESMAPSDVLVDVGANIGFFSMLAATHDVSKIYAIEPNPFSFDALCKNIIKNDLQDVIVPINLAVSNDLKRIQFTLSGTSVGSIENHINLGAERSKFHLELIAMSLDFLYSRKLISKVTHIKIDIDGLEMDVLKGSKGLLSSADLKSVLIEDDGDEAKIHERDMLMSSLGYALTSNFGKQEHYSIFQRISED